MLPRNNWCSSRPLRGNDSQVIMRMIVAVGTLLGLPVMGEGREPESLQIVLESLKKGGDAAYKAIEEDAARICADLKCPNSHLAMESLTGPKEGWWLTRYESESERQRVAAGYANNHALMAALLEIPKRKQSLVGAPIDILANYRRDLSEKDSWKVGGTRFFVVTVTKRAAQPGPAFLDS